MSAIIDVDILPETLRRVRIHKHKSDKPLGFYIRDGTAVRTGANGQNENGINSAGQMIRLEEEEAGGIPTADYTAAKIF